MPAKSLMIQGTTSSAGKTTVAAGLCRLLSRRGIKVAPFKPQNMALNSAVASDGGEIGRAQALQAVACGIPAVTDMNPVLLKPCSDRGAQVIVQGSVFAQMDARTYHAKKSTILPYILESYSRLASSYDRIIIEGAGSPAEINLREGDLANMGFAEAIDCPVIIVADIDRGGVFAHLVGTLSVLSKSEQARVKGFIINRFRGDVDLLQPGIEWLAERTGKPVLGVLPYLHGLTLDGEDSLSRTDGTNASTDLLQVIVPALPRLSNDSDFSALQAHPQVSFRYIKHDEDIPPADLVILPGSKSVCADLEWLRANAWTEYLLKHLRYGGKLLAICGGFQMLGRELHDPHGIESSSASIKGLGLLDMQTELQQQKILAQVEGRLNLAEKPMVRGYEIHMGVSSGPALENAAVLLNGRGDGAITRDGQIVGTYLHGIFDSPQSCQTLLHWAGLADAQSIDFNSCREQALDRLADMLEANLDLELLESVFTP